MIPTFYFYENVNLKMKVINAMCDRKNNMSVASMV